MKIETTEIKDALEKRICSYCEHYNNGEFSNGCRLCKMSIAYQTIYVLEKDKQN